MENLKTITIIFALLFAVSIAQAQNENDALRYSQFSYQASARATGMSGAMGALGADVSVLSSNPAGLAWYRKSVFELTPSMRSLEVKSVLTNEESNEVWRETKNRFSLMNIGFVLAFNRPGKEMSTFNLAMAINEVASFNRNFYFKGDSKGTIVNRFRELANSDIGLNEFESGVAFDAEALYDRLGDQFYESDFDLYPDALITKEQTVRTTGGIKELAFSMAGNANEKFLIGMTFGLPILTFYEEKTYKETDTGEGDVGNVPVFDALAYTENLTATSIGVNLKMGIIYRHSQALRFGAAIHTPTLFGIAETFSSTMEYNYTLNNGPVKGTANSPDGTFAYTLRTPWRFMGNAAYVLGKKGVIATDIEYVNYSKNELQYDGDNEAERTANQLISKNLKSAINIRIGGEMAIKLFRLRAGVELNQSALEGDKTFSTAYSLGAGVRAKGIFFDIAYKSRLSKETYIPYRTFNGTNKLPEQLVDNDNRIGNIVATLGFRF